MSAMPATDDNYTSFLELDDVPTNSRRAAAPAAPPDERMALLDLVDDVKRPVCLDCSKPGPVNDLGVCEACFSIRLTTTVPSATVSVSSPVEFGAPAPAPAPTLSQELGELAARAVEADDFGSPVDELPPATVPLDFASIASESVSNANVQGAAAADGGGLLPIVGFRTQDGYIAAIRNGVPEATHREYLDVLRNRFKLSGSAIAKLNLPPPMRAASLPAGQGVTHAPANHTAGSAGIFERPRQQRQFIVQPKVEQLATRVNVSMKASELIAGAAAAGNHAITAWDGTTGMLRADLVAALATIGRESWAPKAPNARAQAGRAIAKLCRKYDVKPVSKSQAGSELVVNEHAWTVGKVRHTAKVGEAYGRVLVQFKLSGNVLSYSADSDKTIADPVVAEFNRRMTAEEFNSDVTSWLKRTLRDELNGVKFGAMGFLVPAANVAIAKELTEALAKAGFGSDWVHSMPVADGPQLKDGIVRGLVNEVVEQLNELRKERAGLKADRAEAHEAAMAIADETARDKALAELPSGEISAKRREVHIRELRVIYSRVKSYGEVLGEERVDQAERWLRDALAELENLAADDHSSASERFRLIFEELADEAQRAAGGAS